MAQSISQKPTVLFNKGLITEAGELTFPEGASVDELNMSLERDGSRRRRLGLQYEESYQTAGTAAEGIHSSVHLWENAGSQPQLTFIVVQLGKRLHFYEDGDTISANKKSFTLNLNNFLRPTGASAEEAMVQVTSVRGKLIVASPEIDTLKVDYDPDTDTISSERIEFRVRDLEWQGDVSEYSENETTPSNARLYDTLNTGWKGTKGDAALTTFISSKSAHPALTLPWYSGKNTVGDFAVNFWDKAYAGTSLIANGSFTYDLYNIDRSSNQAGATDYVEATRFSAVVSYAGRAFYSGMGNKNTSNIYFSKLVQQDSDLGECLQVNDPTSEVISDLLDTDGGFINIPDAYNIRRLHVLGSQLIVFAENGVWAVKGVDGVFTPTAYSVMKIADNGLTYEGSFVAQEGGRPYWWSNSGIHTLGVSPEQQTLTEVNVSLTTIQTFYSTISPNSRSQVTSVYDALNTRVGWFYPSNDETVDFKRNKVLWLDEALSAFYPWEISDANEGEYFLHPIYTKGARQTSIDYNVVDSAGDQVVDSVGNEVIVTRSGRDYSSSTIRALVRRPNGKVTFAEFTDSSFVDFGTADYTSFAEGGYNFLGDLSRDKKVIYLTPYFRVTEEGLEGGGDSYDFIRPSSCLVSTYWDFRTTPSQTPQEAYRLKALPVAAATGTLSYPYTVTSSRLRLRGGGKSLQLRFESSEGKDFHLLGYDTIAGANRR